MAVAVWPEGTQPEQLAADIAEALAGRPQASQGQAAFEALATFYRKAWLRWIDAIKRRPEGRGARIPERVRLVETGAGEGGKKELEKFDHRGRIADRRLTG